MTPLGVRIEDAPFAQLCEGGVCVAKIRANSRESIGNAFVPKKNENMP